MTSEHSRFYQFGPFRVDTVQHRLLRDSTPIPLTPKAFETLLMLIRNSGRIVEKGDLLQNIWPETFVEEATLAQNIFTLRKALGGSEYDQYIQTIPKRGYRFIATVTEGNDQDSDTLIDQFDKISPAIPFDKPVDRNGAGYSLAVLPLANSSNDPRAEYVSDSITEAVIDKLSLLNHLKVKAFSAVSRYKGREGDFQEIGCELGVDAVFIGRVLQFAENLSIRVELVEVTNGWQVWGEEYKEKLADIHKIQGEIAADIAENIQLHLPLEQFGRQFESRIHTTQAYQLYLRGRYFLNKRTERSCKQAIDCFEQAIEIDSNFAPAHSGLSDCYILYDFYGLVQTWEAIQKARAAAARAVELGDELAETHTSLASIRLIHDRDLVGAEREFRQAVRLNPKYARAHDGYAQCLSAKGQLEEAIAECSLAVELEPLDLEINQHLGSHYLVARQYNQAIKQLQKTLEMGPDYCRARILLGIAYGQKGAFHEAIAQFLQASLLEKSPVLSGFTGYAYAMTEDDKAREILDTLLEESKQSYVPPYSIALVYVGLGNHDKAFEWLQKACVEYSHWRGWLELTPELDSLRADPRFINIVQLRFGKPDTSHLR